MATKEGGKWEWGTKRGGADKHTSELWNGVLVEAARLNRSAAWVMRQCWLLARDRIAALPSEPDERRTVGPRGPVPVPDPAPPPLAADPGLSAPDPAGGAPRAQLASLGLLRPLDKHHRPDPRATPLVPPGRGREALDQQRALEDRVAAALAAAYPRRAHEGVPGAVEALVPGVSRWAVLAALEALQPYGLAVLWREEAGWAAPSPADLAAVPGGGGGAGPGRGSRAGPRRAAGNPETLAVPRGCGASEKN